MPDRRNRRKLGRGRPQLRRGLSVIPSLFTIGNILCGYYSVIASLRGQYDVAAIAIGLGAVLDGLDGRIARLTGTSSEFGVQLDSLADFGTFGVAPAMLAFSWGLSSLEGMDAAIAQHVRQLGWLATFAFVICGALRLARFNIQSQKAGEPAPKRYFVGLPIPAAAGLIAAIVHFAASPQIGRSATLPILTVGSALLWFVLVLTTAFLMISTIRYYSFKELHIVKRSLRMTLVSVAMLIGLIIFYSEIVLLCMAIAYAGSGPVGKLVQIVRRIVHPGRPGVPGREPAHGNIKT